MDRRHRSWRPPVTASRCLAVAGLALIVSQLAPDHARAACNLIPTDPDKFQSVIGATNRPFAGPGETLEVAITIGGCDARTAGLATAPDAYVASYVFKPAPGSKPKMVVVAADCGRHTEAMARCAAVAGTEVPACIPMRSNLPVPAIEQITREGAPIFSLRFPDTAALARNDSGGNVLTGPVAIAITRAEAELPCALLMNDCAELPDDAPLVACIDELHGSDGTCSLAPSHRHPTFPRLVALPRPVPVAQLAPDSDVLSIVAGDTGLVGADDGSGGFLVPVDWRQASRQAPGGKHPAHGAWTASVVVERLTKRLGAASPLGHNGIAPYTAWGRPLPTIADGEGSGTRGSVFDSLQVPLVVLRLTPRTCIGGLAGGSACQSDDSCAGGKCGAPSFSLGTATAPQLMPSAGIESVAAGRL